MEACAVVVIMLFLIAAGLKKPLVPLVIAGMLICRAASVAVGNETLAGRALFFWHCAFFASLGQGISHKITNEKATLMNLEDEADSAARTAFEWAHVTYFPNLLVQSISETATGPEKKYR
jgi:hypothetical protein